MNESPTRIRPASLPAFLRKEWSEAIRQARLLIIVAPLAIFAVLNPVMLKLLPKILGSQMPGLEGIMRIDAAQAVASYLKNVGDICVMVFVLALMGTIAEERASGAYVIPFSRRVQRWQVPVAKFIIYASVAAVGLLGSALVARYYTGVLFPGAPPVSDLLAGALIDLAYYLFILGALLFFSAVTRRGFAAGIFTLGTLMLMPLFGYIPGIGRYLPHTLLGSAVSVATSGTVPAGTGAAAAVALSLSLLGVGGAGVALERAEL